MVCLGAQGWQPGTLTTIGPGLYDADGPNGTTDWFANSSYTNAVGYAQLELYLMGLIDATQVDPIQYATNGAFTNPLLGQFSADSIQTLTINNIIAQEGLRIPTPATSQKNFRELVVILTPNPLTQGELSLLDGRRGGIMEGRDKLAEGICPYFQEPCRNIDGKTPTDVFSGKIAEIDLTMRKLEEAVRKVEEEAAAAEKAQKELDTCTVREVELDKQAQALAQRRTHNQERAGNLERLKAEMAQPVVVDLRNIYRPEDMEALGFIYESVGRAPEPGV
jgi:hypothetical protein